MPATSNQVKAVWRLWRCWSVKQFRVLPRNSILLALAIHLIGWSEEQVWVFCFIGGPWCFRTDVLSLDNNQKCCFRRYLAPLFPLLRSRYIPTSDPVLMKLCNIWHFNFLNWNYLEKMATLDCTTFIRFEWLYAYVRYF